MFFSRKYHHLHSLWIFVDFPASHLRFWGNCTTASPYLSLVSVGFNFTAWSSHSKGLETRRYVRSRNGDDGHFWWKPQQKIQFMRSLIPDFFFVPSIFTSFQGVLIMTWTLTRKWFNDSGNLFVVVWVQDVIQPMAFWWYFNIPCI